MEDQFLNCSDKEPFAFATYILNILAWGEDQSYEKNPFYISFDCLEDMLPFFEFSPIHLLSVDASENLFLTPEGRKALEGLPLLPGGIKVIVVAGQAREGKSYLMNLLAGVSQGDEGGFAIGATYSTCTKGLYCWARRQGDHILLVIDTEGTGDAQRVSSRFDSVIIYLAVLMSSIFIVNTMVKTVHVAKAPLEKLYAALLQSQRSGIRVDDKARGTMYLVFRDSTERVGTEEDLHQALRTMSAKEMLDLYFQKISPWAFPEPCKSEFVHCVQSITDPSILSQEFADKFALFKNECYAARASKRIGDKLATGSMLVTLVETYLDWARSEENLT